MEDFEEILSYEEDIPDNFLKEENIERYFFIDYENVNRNGLNGILKLTEKDCVCIYYSENTQSLTFGLHRRIVASKAIFKYAKITISIKNAVDCKILFDIKDIYNQHKSAEYFIISNDADFDNPIQQYRNIGINIKKISQICEVNDAKSMTVNKKTDDMSKREAKIRTLFGQKFKTSPYIENKEKIIFFILNADDKQSLNNALTRIIPSDKIKSILSEYKDFIPKHSSLPNEDKTDIIQKWEQQFCSLYGHYFKDSIYIEKREKILTILMNAKTRQEANDEMCKIISVERTNKILKQFKPILKDLPVK